MYAGLRAHSRHPSLSRPPVDHVHGSLHGLDAEPLQKLLGGLTAESGHSGTRSATKSRSVSLPAVSAATLKWAGTGGGNRANSTQVTNQAVH